MRFMLSLLTLIVAARVALGQPAENLQTLRVLASAGMHAEALELADRLLGSELTPQGEWFLHYEKLRPAEAFIGNAVGYFLAEAKKTVPPLLEVDLKHQHPNPDKFHGLLYVTAVDLESGKTMWTRGFTRYARVAIDPRDDSLWVWHAQERWFEHVDGVSAETRTRGDLPELAPPEAFQLDCLLDGATELWARTTLNTTNPVFASRYDLTSKEVQKNTPRPFARSPGGLRVLRHSSDAHSTTVSCAPAPTTAPIWKFSVDLPSRTLPQWLDQDVLVLCGLETGIVYRLDGTTGEVKWQASMNASPYSVSKDAWSPYGETDGRIWAIDAADHIHFFDSRSGETIGLIKLSASLIAPPAFGNDGSVVVADSEGFRRLQPPDDHDQTTEAVEIAAIKIRALILLNKPDGIEAAARRGIASVRTARDWELIAAALESGGDPSAGTGARVQQMILSRQTRSTALERSHGLSVRLLTGPTWLAPVPNGPVVLFAGTDGMIRTIEPISGTEIEREVVAGGIGGWWLEDNRLIVHGRDRRTRVAREFARPPEIDLPRARPATPSREGDWYQGPSHRVTVGARQLAIGRGGVFLLHDATQQAEQLVRLAPNARGELPVVVRIAGGEQTLALSVRETALVGFLQIWSHDGSSLIRSVPVSELENPMMAPDRLLRVGRGYLLSTGELTYLPEDPDKPVWRFTHRIAGERPDGHMIRRASFGVPRVIGDRLVVAGSSGGIYIFDLTKAGILP